jgi:2'-5' RNA ligase
VTERLFVAVLPPQDVIAAWDAFLEPRRDAEPGFRWTVPQGWHLTCAFLPAVPESLVDTLAEALADVAARTGAFPVRVAGGAALPDPGHAKVLFLRVAEGTDDLGRLATRCRNAAAGCGIEVEGGRFRPHLTIARTRPFSARRWLTILDAVPEGTWTVDRFALVRSRSLPGGAGYEIVGEYALS